MEIGLVGIEAQRPEGLEVVYVWKYGGRVGIEAQRSGRRAGLEV